MASDPLDNTPPMPQFSLRAAFAATTLFALLFAIAARSGPNTSAAIFISVGLLLAGACGALATAILEKAGKPVQGCIAEFVVWVSLLFIFAGAGLLIISAILLSAELLKGTRL
jgi:hypothetical protein